MTILLNSVDLQLHFSEFVRTLFLQNTNGRLLLIIAVSIVVKEELQKQSFGGVPLKKGVLKNFAKFTRKKHMRQILFFNKVSGLRPATLPKKRPWHRCFPVNLAKFLRTLFLTEHLQWLLLELANETVNYDTKTKAYVPIWARSVNSVSYLKGQSRCKNRFQEQSFADWLQITGF